ncbi:hypothetical protein [Sulfoacidibacillus thermotolerans]|uniref:hypothetical protein n=1 Tax=Sulfoacidibacillus thermotolerans TaxID=1765684 RepID=UPI000D695B93|nr:hypothetical protein [Sulfoacidibacillus thermotolerans]
MYDRSPSPPHFDHQGRDIHFCATCRHIRAIREADGVHFHCSRLGYQTRPNWKFNCWTPRDHYLDTSQTIDTHEAAKDAQRKD